MSKSITTSPSDSETMLGRALALDSHADSLRAEAQALRTIAAKSLDTGGCPEWCAGGTMSAGIYKPESHDWRPWGDGLIRVHLGPVKGRAMLLHEFSHADGTRTWGLFEPAKL
ncbi:hypothetical protein [Demequina gelatinilytica]|uniref:hypothetical protein n=1 Tax=Demequina gelatinilytica TaxID=1638980 RepID=UPI0007841732|nr:hypothetical protein [Demequina gelatinilytica]